VCIKIETNNFILSGEKSCTLYDKTFIIIYYKQNRKKSFVNYVFKITIGGFNKMFEHWSEYVHQNWEAFSSIRKSGESKHYFVPILSEEMDETIENIQDDLEIVFPKDLLMFLKEIGSGYFWINVQDKIGIYKILSLDELYDLYYSDEDEDEEEDEDEDWFITYRLSAWDNLEDQLLAFCVFGEEDSLLYYALDDGGIYYLSRNMKIAESFEEFLVLLDNKVDYFL